MGLESYKKTADQLADVFEIKWTTVYKDWEGWDGTQEEKDDNINEILEDLKINKENEGLVNRIKTEINKKIASIN